MAECAPCARAGPCSGWCMPNRTNLASLPAPNPPRENRRASIPDLGSVTPDTPDNKLLRLDAAAECVFGKNAGISGRTLSRAARAGRLTHYRVANKLFTTPADVLEWVRTPSEPSRYRGPEKNAPASADAAVARAQAAIDAL
jgi:hypothetical protein